MRLGLTGVAALSAAGDLDALLAALERNVPCFSESPPYPAEGLSNARCGRAQGVDRERPAEALLRTVVREALEQAGPTEGPTGLIVGTSSGNICGPWERWHRALIEGAPHSEHGTGRDAPTHAIAEAFAFEGPLATLSVACISGTAVFTVAEGWLRDGLCTRVVVAGVDALSLFVHAGFSGLGALSADWPQPFTPERDGLLLGEGAAALVLEDRPSKVYVGGSGMAADAVHMTAPDRDAKGAIHAARTALRRANVAPEDVAVVSVHGTGTPFNDGMEAVALDTLFMTRPPIQLVKGLIGHTMGAAGAIEAAVAARTAVKGPVLSLSSAFGGMNASVVMSSAPGIDPEPRATRRCPPLTAPTPLKDAWPDAPLRALRANRYVRLGIAGIKTAIDETGPLPEGTALVLGTEFGCRLTDLAYHKRLLEEGAAKVSRLHFAYTVPAAPICEASILFDIKGPMLCFVGSDPVEEADRLVRWGHAPAALAVQLDVPDVDAVGRCVVVRIDQR